MMMIVGVKFTQEVFIYIRTDSLVVLPKAFNPIHRGENDGYRKEVQQRDIEEPHRDPTCYPQDHPCPLCHGYFTNLWL